MLRVAAINFLNPAPLMWGFEHAPRSVELATRYQLHYTHPSQCAAELLSGRADLGLIPIAALDTTLAIVPGCTIASLDRVRSIQLIIKQRDNTLYTEEDATAALASVRTVAADTASRSSLAYAEILFRKFANNHPTFIPTQANPIAMLRQADAAILIGDPALLALESREAIEAAVGPCLWLDVANQWRIRTGLPWVAAVWAVRPEALGAPNLTAAELAADLTSSRDHGLQHTDELVEEWTPRIAIPPATIHHYLTRNIHYILDRDCLRTIQLFRQYAAEAKILPPLPDLQFLK